MEKDTSMSPATLNIMAKKILAYLVTVAFIGYFEFGLFVDAQILGTQLHKKDFDDDELFSTSVDVRARD